jgi:hypothetical protein
MSQVAAVVGALGSVLVLVAYRRRALLFSGFALLVVAEALLAAALVPRHDFARLETPLREAGLVVAVLVVVAAAAVLARYPALVPPLLLIAAPFRIPVTLGTSSAFLLIPLYAVLAAASLALLYRTIRIPLTSSLPPLIAIPAAAFIAFDALSLLWSRDVKEGSIELAFFIFPFAALVIVLVHAAYPRWQTRALATTLVSLTCIFAVIGLVERATRTVIYAPKLSVDNAYTSYFRVSSVFKDPSLYGRYIALGIVIVLLAHLLGNLRLRTAVALVVLLFAGLWFSYSQSSMISLFAAVLGMAIVVADRKARLIIGGAAAALALVGIVLVAVHVSHVSSRRATSDRTRLVSVTTKVIANHPLVGVGVGGQPRASRDEAAPNTLLDRNRSHTTPLTVFAELGVVGFLLYLAFLAAASLAVAQVVRMRNRALGIGLGAVFLVLFVHSLFYAGFFEDPLTWGVLGVAGAALTAPVRSARPETPELRSETRDAVAPVHAHP